MALEQSSRRTRSTLHAKYFIMLGVDFTSQVAVLQSHLAPRFLTLSVPLHLLADHTSWVQVAAR